MRLRASLCNPLNLLPPLIQTLRDFTHLIHFRRDTSHLMFKPVMEMQWKAQLNITIGFLLSLFKNICWDEPWIFYFHPPLLAFIYLFIYFHNNHVIKIQALRGRGTLHGFGFKQWKLGTLFSRVNPRDDTLFSRSMWCVCCSLLLLLLYGRWRWGSWRN